VLRRFGTSACGKCAFKLRFKRRLIGLDKGIKPYTNAAIRESDDGCIADSRVLPDLLHQHRRTVGRAACTASGAGEIQQSPTDSLMGFAASYEPQTGTD